MRRGVACRALHATSLWLLGFRSGCSETVSRVGCGSRTRTIDPYPRTVLRRAQGKRKVRVHGAPCRWCCVQRHYRDACLRRAAPIPDYSGSGCAVGKRPNAHGPALMRPAMSLQGRFAQCHLQGRSTAALRAAGSRCKAPLPPAVRRARQVEQDLWERRSRRRDVRPAGPRTSLDALQARKHGGAARRRIAVQGPAPTVPAFRTARASYTSGGSWSRRCNSQATVRRRRHAFLPGGRDGAYHEPQGLSDIFRPFHAPA